MKITKEQTLKFIDETISKLKVEHDKEQEKYRASAEKEYANWQEVWAPRWGETAKKIAAAVRAGKPVTKDMFPKAISDYYLNDLGLCKRGDFKAAEFKIPQDLKSMKALVSVIADELIDVKSLSAATVRDLFQKYAR